jgi:ABC-type antimicrobial peptide transport system permease subunit
MVVRQGVTTAALGAGLGLILSAVVARLIQFVLFDVGPFDLVTFAGVTAIVGAVVFVANWLPARHTAGLDPVSALRYE